MFSGGRETVHWERNQLKFKIREIRSKLQQTTEKSFFSPRLVANCKFRIVNTNNPKN